MSETLENDFEQTDSPTVQESAETNEHNQEYQDFIRGIELGEGEINAQVLKTSYEQGKISKEELGELAFVLLEKTEAQAKEARVDKLTGLNNKRGFDEKLDRTVQELRAPNEKREHPLQSIIVINLDMNGLKKINDTYGHNAGNKALVALGQILEASVKDKDIVARPGGDEFLVLMPIDSTEENIQEKIFERFKNSLNGLAVEIEDQNGQTISQTITAAAGFAILQKDDTDTTIEKLLDRADKAMYENKTEIKKAL